MVEWKFHQLDKNSDRLLRRKEIRVVKRLIKKIVHPKPCAVTFDLHCDLDGDTKVTVTEWTLCLGINNNNHGDASPCNRDDDEFTQQGSMTSQQRSMTPLPNDVTDADEDNKNYDDVIRMGVFPPNLLDYNYKSPQKADSLVQAPFLTGSDAILDQTPFLTEKDASVLNCAREREMALELDRRHPEGHVFIPRCLATGQYAPAQCHTSTGYCWCVDDVTRRPVPGTSTMHDVIPDCDVIASRRQPRRHPDEGTQFLTFPVPT